MKGNSSTYIYVIGNEKGGAGKTTCAMHLISSLLDKGNKVVSIDTDSRQHSLTDYIDNRKAYNQSNPDHQVSESLHFHLAESVEADLKAKEEDEKRRFEAILNEVKGYTDYVVIDTPGSNTYLSRLAHSYADTIITPINDSFVDLAVMAKVNPLNMNITGPSIYSQTIWEQKMQRAARDRGSIEWVVMRNRLSNLDAVNKRNVNSILEQLSKRISFKVAPGFSERVIFRELFLQGLTLLDLTKANYAKAFNISHVAARQELRNFLSVLGLDAIPQKDLSEA
jgi:chromosome partitioning protein